MSRLWHTTWDLIYLNVEHWESSNNFGRGTVEENDELYNYSFCTSEAWHDVIHSTFTLDIWSSFDIPLCSIISNPGNNVPNSPVALRTLEWYKKAFDLSIVFATLDECLSLVAKHRKWSTVLHCTVSHSVGPPGVKVWTLVTATFYEKNIVFVSEAGIDVLSLLLINPLIDTCMYVCMYVCM